MSDITDVEPIEDNKEPEQCTPQELEDALAFAIQRIISTRKLHRSTLVGVLQCFLWEQQNQLREEHAAGLVGSHGE